AWGVAAMLFIGLASGFFGLGAGWAIVPAINFIMAVPLKVAAAVSSITIGMGDCVTVWPYIYAGAMLPLFVAPWLLGQVLGGILGAQVLISVRSESIRYILIGIMAYTGFGLITNGLKKLNLMGDVPGWVSLTVLLVILAVVTVMILCKHEKGGKNDVEVA
ncbi:MAG: sulfite exporter TauE/SafE family protein, partial [Bacillota bacterium]